jgi:hypothetical protein
LTGKSGLSSTMEIGSMAKLVLDERVALRVKFQGEPPPQRQLYFRGPVLSNFDGRQWIGSGGRDGPGATFSPGPADLQVSGAPIRYQVTIEPSQQPWLLTLDVPPSSPNLPGTQRARMTADMQWMTYRPITDLLRYSAESYPDFRYGLTRWDKRPVQDMREYLSLPANFNPRTQALADQLRAQLGDADPMAYVRAALERLRTGGYEYTLEPGVAGQHTADEFWFDTKAGFCEHISSAFVVLMRGAGVPARIVTGFQGGELNSLDGFWTVRNADAHAWAEVWTATGGWTRVDPTGAVSPGRVGQFQRLRAPDGLVAGALGTLSPTLLAQLRATWEAIDNGWNQWVLNYTQSRQFDLMEKLGISSPSWEDLAKILAGLLTMAAVAGMVWARWERSQHDPWLRLLHRARQRLAQAGVTTPPQSPPRELMHAVAQSQLPPALRDELARWLQALERQRYAPAGSAGAAANLATLAREFQQLAWPRPA